MFLESHFGSDSITPIEKPRLAANLVAEDEDEVTKQKKLAQTEVAEMERLHGLGIPVPGLEIRIEKLVAKVWLENLEVECATRSFKDRVQAVVERATEVVRPIWE